VSVFAAIRGERGCGVVHVGSSEATTLSELARAFKLGFDDALYREIDRDAARAILIELLHRDLAYLVELMPAARAAELADGFLTETARPGARYFTNRAGMYNAWNPATAATFDLGVLVLSDAGSACLWVEDED
jgi:hypothetical protein